VVELASMHPRGFEPMLASTTLSPVAAEYALEPKLDGWCVVVHVRDKIRVFTRPGRAASSLRTRCRGSVDGSRR
jgi:ATP-dependent DNA ligase